MELDSSALVTGWTVMVKTALLWQCAEVGLPGELTG